MKTERTEIIRFVLQNENTKRSEITLHKFNFIVQFYDATKVMFALCSSFLLSRCIGVLTPRTAHVYELVTEYVITVMCRSWSCHVKTISIEDSRCNGKYA